MADQLMAAYLSYRGTPVEGAEGQQPNHVILVAPAIAAKGRCVDWVNIMCQTARRPAPGDLVVVLPNDQASRLQAAEYRDRREEMLSYKPRPPTSHWLHPVGDLFTIARYTVFADTPVPNRWMDASVTLWK